MSDPRIDEAMRRLSVRRQQGREMLSDEAWTQRQAEWQRELDSAAAARRERLGWKAGPDRTLAPVVVHPSSRAPKVSRDVPSVYEGCSFETWQGAVGFDASPLRDWRGEPATVLLLGPQGVGKSHLGVAVYREWYADTALWMRFGRKPRWITADGYVQRLKREMFEDRGNVAGWMGEAGLLVLDDLGRERPTEWSVSELSALLMQRWADERPTFITSNLSAEDLQQWEPRVASRLLGCDGLLVDLNGLADYRQRSA